MYENRKSVSFLINIETLGSLSLVQILCIRLNYSDPNIMLLWDHMWTRAWFSFNQKVWIQTKKKLGSESLSLIHNIFELDSLNPTLDQINDFVSLFTPPLIRVYIGSGLISFRSNRIRSVQTVWFFQFNGSVRFGSFVFKN